MTPAEQKPTCFRLVNCQPPPLSSSHCADEWDMSSGESVNLGVGACVCMCVLMTQWWEVNERTDQLLRFLFFCFFVDM